VSEEKFQYIGGSYGDELRGYFSSILCKKLVQSGLWVDHYCLLNPSEVLDNQDLAAETAVRDFNEAKASSKNPVDVAQYLKAKGYDKLEEFKIVRVGNE
jgi:hypothetical protein